jgi:exo-poly-alpha-galacturonosidase
MPRHARLLAILMIVMFGNLIALSQTRKAAAVLPAQNLLVLPRSETETSIALLWDKPANHENIAGYEVSQNGVLVATTPPDKTFYGADKLVPGNSYSFWVVAKDAANNRSTPTATVTASTRSVGVVIDVSAAPYNAGGDGIALNTVAIQKAIDDCPPGGTVRIPPGTFLTGALVLKSEMTFEVASGGVLKGSTDPNHYLPMIRTRYMGVECDCYQPLIRIGTMDHNAGYTSRNVTLRGAGEIRGGGETLGLQQSYDHRSRLILIQNCQNVAILGLHLTYPAGWTVHPLYSDNVTAWNIRIDSWDARKGKSGDGFDPDSSTNCYLVNSVLHTWDNSFGPKSGRGLEGYKIARPSKHIRAVGCTFEGGAPCLGSEVSGGIEDVVIRDSTIIGIYVYIKTNDGRGAYIKDFVMENVEFTHNHSKNIWIDTNCQIRNRPPKAPGLTACSDFVFKDIKGCGDIVIDGGFGLASGPERPSYVRNVTFSNVQLRKGRGVQAQYCDGVRFDNVRCADGSQPVYTLTGTNYNVVRDGAPLGR